MGNNIDLDKNKSILKSVLKGKSDKELNSAKNFLESVLLHKKVAKLNDTYIKGTRTAMNNSGFDKVFVNYRLADVVTGRLSCAAASAGKNNKLGVSFHTLPRTTEYNIRDMFIGTFDRRWFITTDFKAMEMRYMAHASEDPKMIEAFYSGEDLHSFTASMIFNKKIPDITKEERQLAKAVSFLIIYGGGATTLAQNSNITVSHAQDIINAYKKSYPKVFEYMAECEAIIKDTKQIRSEFGRVRHLPNITSPVPVYRSQAIRQGINFTIQSAASDILLMAMIGYQQDINEKHICSKIVGLVHDSMEVITRRDYVQKSIECIRNNMVNNPYLKRIFKTTFKVPFEIDMELGTSFGNGLPVNFDSSGSPTNVEEIMDKFNHA